MFKPTRFAAFVLGAALSLSQISTAHAADTYKLDANHTAITWHISHFGFSSPSGKFMNVDGKLELDEKNPAASRVSLTIPVGDIDTGVAKLDEHLKGDQFFNVATYPTATFVSDKVEVTGKDTAVVHGSLTLHGVTKPVALKVKLNKIGENMFKLKTAGFSATTTLKRSDFGMTTYLPGLGDDVTIDIESEANLAAANG
jgi:polyisoprenoid-binding protein YceI